MVIFSSSFPFCHLSLRFYFSVSSLLYVSNCDSVCCFPLLLCRCGHNSTAKKKKRRKKKEKWRRWQNAKCGGISKESKSLFLWLLLRFLVYISLNILFFASVFWSSFVRMKNDFFIHISFSEWKLIRIVFPLFSLFINLNTHNKSTYNCSAFSVMQSNVNNKTNHKATQI